MISIRFTGISSENAGGVVNLRSIFSCHFIYTTTHKQMPSVRHLWKAAKHFHSPATFSDNLLLTSSASLWFCILLLTLFSARYFATDWLTRHNNNKNYICIHVRYVVAFVLLLLLPLSACIDHFIAHCKSATAKTLMCHLLFGYFISIMRPLAICNYIKRNCAKQNCNNNNSNSVR